MNTAVSTRLSPALAKQLAAEAGSRKMTSSAMVRGIIAEHFNNKDITETLSKMQLKLDAIDGRVKQAVDGINNLVVEEI